METLIQADSIKYNIHTQVAYAYLHKRHTQMAQKPKTLLL